MVALADIFLSISEALLPLTNISSKGDQSSFGIQGENILKVFCSNIETPHDPILMKENTQATSTNYIL